MKRKNEINLNGFSGREASASCRRMTEKENACRRMTIGEMSFPRRRESIKHYCQMDARSKSGMTEEELSPSDTLLLSSSGLTGGSIKQQCRFATGECGRSMVEMLGVLAIIGVLSVGGIAGYNYAMNKYRANETINEINMRLMTLQTQSERDVDLNLNEFADTTPLGYTIGDNYGWAEDDTRIYVGISGLPQGTCEIIYDEMIAKVERIDVTADRTADVNTLCGDNNEMKFYVGSGVEVACDPACAEDEYCMSGIKCVKAWENKKTRCGTMGDIISECEKCSGVGWSTPMYSNGLECNDGNGICSNGICLPKEVVMTCADNGNECPYGQYCASIKQTITKYGCVPIEFSPITIELSNGKVETWYKSDQYISWYDAMAACKAMNKKIPSKAEWDNMPEQIEKLESAWTSTEAGACCAYTTISFAPVQSKGYGALYALCR